MQHRSRLCNTDTPGRCHILELELCQTGPKDQVANHHCKIPKPWVASLPTFSKAKTLQSQGRVGDVKSCTRYIFPCSNILIKRFEALKFTGYQIRTKGTGFYIYWHHYLFGDDAHEFPAKITLLTLYLSYQIISVLITPNNKKP